MLRTGMLVLILAWPGPFFNIDRPLMAQRPSSQAREPSPSVSSSSGIGLAAFLRREINAVGYLWAGLSLLLVTALGWSLLHSAHETSTSSNASSAWHEPGPSNASMGRMGPSPMLLGEASSWSDDVYQQAVNDAQARTHVWADRTGLLGVTVDVGASGMGHGMTMCEMDWEGSDGTNTMDATAPSPEQACHDMLTRAMLLDPPLAVQAVMHGVELP